MENEKKPLFLENGDPASEGEEIESLDMFEDLTPKTEEKAEAAAAAGAGAK